jgi:hypothetical protein
MTSRPRSPERSSHRPCVWRKRGRAAAADRGGLSRRFGACADEPPLPESSMQTGCPISWIAPGCWCASGDVATSGFAPEAMLAGGCYAHRVRQRGQPEGETFI